MPVEIAICGACGFPHSVNPTKHQYRDKLCTQCRGVLTSPNFEFVPDKLWPLQKLENAVALAKEKAYAATGNYLKGIRAFDKVRDIDLARAKLEQALFKEVLKNE